MKFRKVFAAALTLSLGLGLAAPGLAADAADQRLAAVTLKVKNTLGLGDDYTQFYGEPNETMLGTRWELTWSDDGRSLSVSCTEEGKLLSLNRWDDAPEAEARYSGKYSPALPAMTRQQAGDAAQAFLDRVLTEGEQAVFDRDGAGDTLGAANHSFRGEIRLNGLASPLRFSLRVRLSDGEVVSFWRDDVSQYVGSLPAPETSTTAQAAAEQLKTTLSLRLEYVRDEAGQDAVLRYLPEDRDDYYVDAATGALVNLTELREQMWQNAATCGTKNALMAEAADAAAPEEGGVRLSQAELEGVAKLEGVLDQEALDQAAGKWKELGLASFELGASSYRVDRETDEVTASLTYVKKDGEGISRRSLNVDARTGALLSMGGYNAYDETPGKLSKQEARKNAEAFLNTLWPGQFSKCELYSSTESDSRTRSEAWVFTYAQKVNGYFFPDNSITVRVCAGDGSIMGFDKRFDEDVLFDSADGLISAGEALDIWAGSYPVELSYIAVPVKLDLLGHAARPLINMGYSYYDALKPGYALGTQDKGYWGVDAKTGELVSWKTSEPEIMGYDDISGHWAEEILTALAGYGVGWWGGKADPDRALTQLDYLSMLLSADGYRYLPGESDPDDLYAYAVRRGFLTMEERQDEALMTRSAMVKILLDSLGYKEIANLPGIFRCDFSDADVLSGPALGYAALAQALGLISGDRTGSYAPDRISTRAEAAALLWNYMNR